MSKKSLDMWKIVVPSVLDGLEFIEFHLIGKRLEVSMCFFGFFSCFTSIVNIAKYECTNILGCKMPPKDEHTRSNQVIKHSKGQTLDKHFRNVMNFLQWFTFTSLISINFFCRWREASCTNLRMVLKFYRCSDLSISRMFDGNESKTITRKVKYM